MAKIDDVTERVSTWNPARQPDTLLAYIDLSAVSNSFKKITGAQEIFGRDAPSRARQLVRRDDVLVSTVRPNLNAVAIVPASYDGATVSTGFAVLRPSSEIDGRYLFHWVRSPAFVGDMTLKATGASYPAVSERIVKESRLPHPDIDEQRRVASILDQADSLVAKRRESIDHLDDLRQSIFEDMFGTIEPVSRLGDFVAEFRYGTSTKSSDSGLATIRIPDVLDGRIRLEGLKRVPVSDAEGERLTVSPGDILLVRSNGNPANVGRAAVVPTMTDQEARVIFASYLIRARLRRPEFADVVVAFLASPRGRRLLKDSATTSAGQYNINTNSLKGLPMIPLVDESARIFRARMIQLESRRNAAAHALEHAGELFAALQSRAFRGEL